MTKIYLDSAATAPPCAAAVSAAVSAIENFGNPSSLHHMGIAAEKEVNGARSTIARAIGAKDGEIYFTSGGTESNNLALFGGAKIHNGTRIIATAAEHPSVIEPLKALAQKGFEIFYLPLAKGGLVCPDTLAKALDTPTCLVSIHQVNNETGVTQNIAALGKIIKETSPKTLFHVDGVQSFCKIPINVQGMRIDLFSISAHKIGGLKGCGGLFVREKVHLNPMMMGGGQEKNLRPGTENVPAIAGFGASTRQQSNAITANYNHVNTLKERFISALHPLDAIEINGENTMPYIINISVDGVRPEVLLNALSAKGVYISAGAACSSNKRQKDDESAVLLAYGLDKQRAETAVRISFSPGNTLEEIEIAAEIFTDCVATLRKMKKLR